MQQTRDTALARRTVQPAARSRGYATRLRLFKAVTSYWKQRGKEAMREASRHACYHSGARSALLLLCSSSSGGTDGVRTHKGCTQLQQPPRVSSPSQAKLHPKSSQSHVKWGLSRATFCMSHVER